MIFFNLNKLELKVMDKKGTVSKTFIVLLPSPSGLSTIGILTGPVLFLRDAKYLTKLTDVVLEIRNLPRKVEDLLPGRQLVIRK